MDHIRFSHIYVIISVMRPKGYSNSKGSIIIFTIDQLKDIGSLHVRNVFRMNDFLTALN